MPFRKGPPFGRANRDCRLNLFIPRASCLPTMVFTTATFLVFLAVVFCLYWALGDRRWQNILLVIAGYAFYAWWDYRYCILMIISTLVDYYCGIGCSKPKTKKLCLLISLISNLGMLGVFKYFNFFQDSFIAAFDRLGVGLDPIPWSYALPVGISFYTFQTLSYTIDIYRDKLKPHTNFIDYAAYVCFFPQLVAGPIERASSLLPQFGVNRKFDPDLARDGLRQILWGFFKKMVIADRCGTIVNEIYENPGNFDSSYLWLAAIGFSFQIYCDFSAYSDIAIGTARLFGFSLTRNFANPYFSQDFVEFWRRWHITLSTWFRDYVYIPLGGNRVGPTRQWVNVLIVFTVSGLWHGAGWNFVIWGAIHGFLVAVSSRLRAKPLTLEDVPLGAGIPSILAIIRCLFVFAISCLAWVFFRIEGNFELAMDIVRRMTIGFETHTVTLSSSGILSILKKLMPVFLLVEFLTRDKQHPLQAVVSWPRPLRWIVYLVLIWLIMYYMPDASGEFVYFQF